MANDGMADAGTIDKIATIIRRMADTGSIGVSELAADLDIPKSTLHYHLDRLCENNLVLRDSAQYRLSLRFLEIGEQVRNNIEMYEIAKPEVDALATQLNELTVLMVEENGLGVYLYKSTGDEAIDVDAPVGRHAYLHNRATGKAIFAHLDEDTIEEIAELHGFPGTTEQTITDRSRLAEERERIRREGVAYNREESLPGLLGIAVPILYGEEIHGALGLAGPVTRLDEQLANDRVLEDLQKARNRIELKMQQFDGLKNP